MKIDQIKKDYLVMQVARLRKKFGYPPLENEDYRISNLIKEYAELTDLEDYYSENDY